MVFPSEASMLESFLVTYDELGFDEGGTVDPSFVEWITAGPEFPVHETLKELSNGWTSDHPCWLPDHMPRLSDPDWPVEIVAPLLGVAQTRLVSPPPSTWQPVNIPEDYDWPFQT
jgi:hypothetical protein